MQMYCMCLSCHDVLVKLCVPEHVDQGRVLLDRKVKLKKDPRQFPFVNSVWTALKDWASPCPLCHQVRGSFQVAQGAGG